MSLCYLGHRATHTHTDVHADSHTDKQLNDMASLVSRTVYPNCAQIRKRNPVYTPLSFTTHTHTAHTSVKVLHPVWTHCVLTRALLWPITGLFRSHNKDKGPLSLRMLNTHTQSGNTHTSGVVNRSECVAIIESAPSMEISPHVC